MNESKSTDPIADEATTQDKMLRRRTVVGAAAWAAPVIAMSVASPAHAASGPVVTLTLDAPATAVVGMLAPDVVYATVLADDSPSAGVMVTFTVANASLGGFGADGEQTVTEATNDAGVAYPPAMLLKAEGEVEVTATASGRTAVAFITGQAANGTMAFKQSEVNAGAASTFALSGVLTRTSGTGYPAEVSIAYPDGFSGPVTVPVDQATGEFLVAGVSAGTLDGSITASAPGFGTASVAITLVLGYISTPQAIYAAGKDLPAPRGTYAITGTVNRVTPGADLPATVSIAWKTLSEGIQYENVTGFTNGQTVPVDQLTGAFALPILTPIDTGRADGAGGFFDISAPGYLAFEVAVYNRADPGIIDLYNNMSTTPAITVFAPGETRDVPGQSMSWGTLHEVVYPEGFSGPATFSTDSRGGYIVRGVKAPEYITTDVCLMREPGSGGYTSRGIFSVL
ncbi:hypothetical protein ACPPVW_00915 [Leifsonia sp. McL0607]|uniref:hypothetical protein n=1 Tax=Leifsonia sp. McL0607 TaxID=3415672 RepID=UPI003CEB1AA3